MLKSMTGFGSSSQEINGWRFGVEIRSCNHRHCDLHLHVPPDWTHLVAEIESMLRSRILRGRVDLTLVAASPPLGSATFFDVARALAAKAAIEELASVLKISDPVRLDTILAAPGVLRGSEALKPPEGSKAGILRAVEAALADLMEMRLNEGSALGRELEARNALLRDLVSKVGAEVAHSMEQRETRLKSRIQELMGAEGLEPWRVSQEVALLVERADVSEELARMHSHCNQFDGLLMSPEPAGRRLDFLLQEMNRETNTIGAKSGSAHVSYRVVEMKAEIEKLREQVQNVE